MRRLATDVYATYFNCLISRLQNILRPMIYTIIFFLIILCLSLSFSPSLTFFFFLEKCFPLYYFRAIRVPYAANSTTKYNNNISALPTYSRQKLISTIAISLVIEPELLRRHARLDNVIR